MEVSFLECGQRKQALEGTGKVAAVAQILQACQSSPKNRAQFLPIFGGHGEIPLQVLLDLHLREALFRFLALSNVDAKIC